MRKHNGCTAGWIAIILGGLIFLALILPQWLWWLLCAAALVSGGISILRG